MIIEIRTANFYLQLLIANCKFLLFHNKFGIKTAGNYYSHIAFPAQTARNTAIHSAVMTSGIIP